MQINIYPEHVKSKLLSSPFKKSSITGFTKESLESICLNVSICSNYMAIHAFLCNRTPPCIYLSLLCAKSCHSGYESRI